MIESLLSAIVHDSRRQGWLLPVKAQAGGRTNSVRGVHQGELRVSVTQAPEKGRANRAIQEVLCRALDLRRPQVELVAGETSAHKQFLIRDLTREELEDRLRALVQDAT